MELSLIAGYISILFWLIVFIPQLKENYSRRNGDGLSLTFLYIWLAGDIFNLAGIMMENLLFTMFLLALWYTVADICLIWQVIYYQARVTKETPSNETVVLVNQPLKQRRISLERASLLEEEQVTSNMKPVWINVIGSTVLILFVFIACFGYSRMTRKVVGDTGEIRVLPQVFGWCSCGLYVGSRIPQLIKNWREQSTDGLSPGMFICAVFGNLFFALSIFLKSTEKRYIIINLSWIIGSLGTVLFDLMIFIQFYTFNRRKSKQNRAD